MTDKCPLCGRNVRYNHPYRTPGGSIICDHCGSHRVSGLRLQGVDQSTYDFVDIYCEDGIVIWFGYHDEVCAWTDGGSTAFALSDGEKELSVDELFTLIKSVTKEGFRCSHSKGTFGPDVRGEGVLFAGIVCPECYEKQLEKAEREHASGHMCLMCGKPYSECYC